MTVLEALLAGMADARRHWGQTVLALVGLVLGAASIVTVLFLVGGQMAQTERCLRELGGSGTLYVRMKEQAVGARAFDLSFAIPVYLPGVVASLVFSGVVGLVFGWYPAYRASKLNPVEAIFRV